MLDHLAEFEVFLTSPNLEAAALTLGLTQDELLADINELSDALGVQLVDRTGEPTRAARRLAGPAKDVLIRANELFDIADALATRGDDDPLLLWRGNGPRPSALADHSSRYVKVNDAFARMVGWDNQSLIGLDFRRITHEADLAADEQQDDELFSGELVTYRKRKRYVTPKGRVRHALVTCSRVVHGEEVAYLLVADPVVIG